MLPKETWGGKNFCGFWFSHSHGVNRLVNNRLVHFDYLIIFHKFREHDNVLYLRDLMYIFVCVYFVLTFFNK